MNRESSAAGITDEDLAPYRGRWIALLHGKVIAQGGTPKQVSAAAQAGRFKEVPKVMFVPMQESLRFTELFTRVVEELPAGLPAYLAGGAVRDAMLGRPVHDMDFVLFGKVLSISRRIADRIGAAYYPLDEERQTARLVLITENGTRQILDFSAPRGEDLESDLRARDFTINAMAVDVHRSQELLDPLGGASDLRQRLLRTTTRHSLEDDPVRMLRGIRMSAQFNLRILPETRELMQKASNRLNRISPERLRDEIFRIFAAPRPGASILALDILGALDKLFPELAHSKGIEQSEPHVFDVWRHSLDALNKIEVVLQVLSPAYNPDLANNLLMGMAVLRLGRFRQKIGEHLAVSLSGDRLLDALLLFAALYHDAGKPQTRTVEENGRVRFFNHDEMGEMIIAKRARALRLSNVEIEHLRKIVRHHLRPMLLANTGQVPSRRAVYRFFRDTGASGVDVCLLSLGDVLATYGPTLPAATWARHLDVVGSLLEAYWEHPEESVAPKPIINGSEIIEETGIPPGPLIGRVLSEIREAQAEGKISSYEDALAFARQILSTIAGESED